MILIKTIRFRYNVSNLRKILLDAAGITARVRICMVNLLPKYSMTKIHGLIHAGDGPANNPGNSLSRE